MTTMRPPFQLTLDLPILAGVKPRVRPCERSKWPRRCPNPKARHPRVLNPPEPPWYGPVCPVVWEGWRRETPPYPDYTKTAQTDQNHRQIARIIAVGLTDDDIDRLIKKPDEGEGLKGGAARTGKPASALDPLA